MRNNVDAIEMDLDSYARTPKQNTGGRSTHPKGFKKSREYGVSSSWLPNSVLFLSNSPRDNQTSIPAHLLAEFLTIGMFISAILASNRTANNSVSAIHGMTPKYISNFRFLAACIPFESAGYPWLFRSNFFAVHPSHKHKTGLVSCTAFVSQVHRSTKCFLFSPNKATRKLTWAPAICNQHILI